MPEVKIAVTFGVGYLSKLALTEAAKMEFLKDKPLTSKCVFSDANENIFIGIEVFAITDES